MRKLKHVVYVPNQFVKMGFTKLLPLMLRDFVSSFSLGWRLFMRDFTSKYKQQVFGILWVVIIPCIAVLSFFLLAEASVLNIGGIDAPYPIYAFLSVAIWGLIQGVISAMSGVINSARSMVIQINFAKEALLISPLFISILDFGIKMLLFILLVVFWDFSLDPFNIIYVLLVIPAILFAAGLGMFFSIVGSIIKDVQNFISFFFQFLLLATPIMYALPEDTLLGRVSLYNPFYYLVVVPRDLILFGHTEYFQPFWYCSVLSLIVFIAGWRFYKIATTRILEKV